MPVQEIIVYRNPGEKLMWDFFLNGQGSFIWVIITYGLVAALAVTILYTLWSIVSTRLRFRRRRW